MKTHTYRIRVDGRKRSKTQQKETDDRKYGRRVCLCMCMEFDLSHNVQFYLIRTFLCGLSKTHQNGSVDAEGSMRFR